MDEFVLEVVQMQSLADQLKKTKLKKDMLETVVAAKKALKEYYDRKGENKRGESILG